jgi:hypothetical protein
MSNEPKSKEGVSNMRKTILCLAALVAGGLVFSGCVYTDGPNPQIVAGQDIHCHDLCGETDPAQGWADGIMGTAGPPGSVLPNEEGNYYNFNQACNPGEELGDPCLWEVGAGGNFPTRVDTIHMPLADEASGCPPYTYQCSWGTWPLSSQYLFCMPDPVFPAPNLPHACDLPNKQCTGPSSAFRGLPGSSWYLAPPNTDTTNLHYLAVDEDPTGGCLFMNNMRRQPGHPCPACGTSASALQAPPGKTVVCHVPPGNPGNAHTIIVGDSAVPAHLAHGDYLGECSGGPGGAGREVVPVNDGPVWFLALCWLVDTNIYVSGDGSAWTDDYSSCLRGNCGGANGAIDAIADALAANPADENGLVTIGVSKLNAFGESTELNPPLQVGVRMEVVREGWPAFDWAVDMTQPSYQTMLQWAARNLPDETQFTGTGLSVELTSGHVLQGTTLVSSLPYAVAFNTDRIDQLIEDMEEMDFESRDNLDLRVATR